MPASNDVNTESHGRVRYIDGLRAVAVLAVVVSHAAPVNSAFHLGAHGLDLFFVLSGFCLSYPLLERKQRVGKFTFDIVRYTAQRLTRILPPYYAAIAILASLPLVYHLAVIPLPNGIVVVPPFDIVRQALFFDNGVHFLNRVF